MGSVEGSLLVGDIGGTNVRLALARLTDDGGVAISDVWRRPGSDFPDFGAAIAAYLGAGRGRIAGASFGFAGPVSRGEVQLLHRDWTIRRADLQAQLGVERVVLVNDFFAMARSAPELGAADLHEIAPGTVDRAGSLAVGGPGTGFGVAVLRRFHDETLDSGAGWAVVGGEGGHQAFAPQTELEWSIAKRLKAELGYVSNEVVASGSGFEPTLAALAHAMGVPRQALTPSDVIERAGTGEALSVEMCRLRARTVMTAMGNTALACNATGGVFIAGGVSVYLEPWLKEREALDRFYRRGPRTALMTGIPIQLIVSETAPLVGSALLWRDEQGRGWL
jgi:glucokinase